VRDQEKLVPAQTNQSSDKLLYLLEILSEQPEPIRLQDISRISGMNASTALRFIGALARRGYIAQDIDTGRYYLTLKLCGLGQNISANLSVRGVALPFMRKVAHAFGESCNLAVENDMSVLYVEVVNSSARTLMSTQRIGTAAPMHCTGVGKLLLSEYTPQELERVVRARPLEKFTDTTIVDNNALIRELEQVRRLGYAYDNEECENGARCIAAPVRDYTGKIVAGISVSGPGVRMSDEHIDTHLPSLLEAARQVSLQLGWKEV